MRADLPRRAGGAGHRHARGPRRSGRCGRCGPTAWRTPPPPARSTSTPSSTSLFANALPDEEVENWVNLVRKRDRCQAAGPGGGQRARERRGRSGRRCGSSATSPRGSSTSRREEAEGIRVSLLSYYISSQLPFVGIAKSYVTIRDIDAVLDHTIGHVAYPGRLGGKAAGMIVAQKILLPMLGERDPDFERHIAVPDTWYISSGVFSDFIDRNDFHVFHTHKYRTTGTRSTRSTSASAGLFETADLPAGRRWRSSATSSARSASTRSSCAPPATSRTASAWPSRASTSPCSSPTRAARMRGCPPSCAG